MDDGSQNAAAAVSVPGAVVAIDENDEEVSWSCVRCTFLNHAALNACECCLLERPLKSGLYLAPTMTNSLENLELTAVREESENRPKLRALSGKKSGQGKHLMLTSHFWQH